MLKSQIREFEEQRKADIDAMRDELKARPPAVINYIYLREWHARIAHESSQKILAIMPVSERISDALTRSFLKI